MTNLMGGNDGVGGLVGLLLVWGAPSAPSGHLPQRGRSSEGEVLWGAFDDGYLAFGSVDLDLVSCLDFFRD